MLSEGLGYTWIDQDWSLETIYIYIYLLNVGIKGLG